VADPEPGWLALEGITWETYEKLRNDLDDAGAHVQIVYDDGTMWIMAPLLIHVRRKTLVGRMIGLMSFLLDIPIASCGSATWKRKELRKGLEADECYYVQHASQIGGRVDLDLKRDPLPDLVIEVGATRSPAPKFSAYAAMGVAEGWHFHGKKLRCLHLRKGKYQPAAMSLAFPFLRPAELQRFIELLPAQDELAVMRAFGEWLQTLRPKK